MVNCPIDSQSFHKLCYIVQDPTNFTTCRMMILPYLHEKKIFLNRDKPNSQYFYTSFYQELPSYFKTELGVEAYNLINNQKTIVAMNLTESKFYTYSKRGILRNRFDFSSFTKRYGTISSVSPNGRNFIFAKKVSHFVSNEEVGKDSFMNNESFEQEDLVEPTKQGQTMELTVVHLTEYEFIKIKQIVINDEIAKFNVNL